MNKFLIGGALLTLTAGGPLTWYGLRKFSEKNDKKVSAVSPKQPEDTSSPQAQTPATTGSQDTAPKGTVQTQNPAGSGEQAQ